METRKSAGILATEPAAAVTLSSDAFDELTSRVSYTPVSNLVLDRINQFHVTESAGKLANGAGNTFIALPSESLSAS